MELNFKDSKTLKLFNDVESLNLPDVKIEEVEDEIEDEIEKEIECEFEEKEFQTGGVRILSSSSSDTKEIPPPQLVQSTIDIASKQQLQRIESKQNAIIEILSSLPLPKVNQVNLDSASLSDIDNFKLNLRLFNEKFIILSTESTNKNIKEILQGLEKISLYLISNSLNTFSKESSPITELLEKLSSIGVGDSLFNKLIDSSISILKDIEINSKKNYFEQSYYYSNLLLSRGLILNSVTLFNEAVSMYIVESSKNLSHNIYKYIITTTEPQDSKLNSQAKSFFIDIFLDSKDSISNTPFFHHHKISKAIDREIERKFIKILTTLKNRGDEGVFKRYAYIAKKLRKIRNSLAHGDLEVNFKSLKEEIESLNDDFYVLAIKKNILKRKES